MTTCAHVRTRVFRGPAEHLFIERCVDCGANPRGAGVSAPLPPCDVSRLAPDPWASKPRADPRQRSLF